MPRLETLSDIVPNRYYAIEAQIKYIHHTSQITTAIIQQGEIQKKIKLPSKNIKYQQGGVYRFQKCFYSRNGWLSIKQNQVINQIKTEERQYISLSEINENKQKLVNHYLTTILHVVQIGCPQKKQKQGEDLNLSVLKCYADGYMVDVTLWNRELDFDIIGKTIIFQGFRLKLMTKNSFVLVSTVYSKFTQSQEQITNFNPKNKYLSLSQVYNPRSITQMIQDLNQNVKSLSVISAKITQANVFDYEGCVNCHRKLQQQQCLKCNSNKRAVFWVCQLTVKDQSGECIVYVFDQKIQGALKLARKGSSIKGRVKSTIKLTGGQNVATHILVGLNNIDF